MEKRKPRYWYLDHTADIGCEVVGRTKRELYENAALALYSLIVNREMVRERQERAIQVKGVDELDLWVNYLRELLFLVNGGNFIGHTVQVKEMRRKIITCVVKGEDIDFKLHGPFREVKAVTYHGAQIERTSCGWRGRFICDI
ncbi:MAG: archease [Syntrophales bacterium]|nr:archease [Syntrophales bacterium]